MQQMATSRASGYESLIVEHIGLALSVARRMAKRLPKGVSQEDLESSALLGLTEAAHRYDAERQESFMAFAAKRVRGAILDYLRHNDILSRRGRRAARQVADAARQVEATHGRSATDSDLAQQLGLSESEFHQSYADVRQASVVSMDDLEGMLADPEFRTPSEILEKQQVRAALMRALGSLDERQVLILACYYQEALTLREIGELLGITESRVCQIHARAVRILREHLA